MADPNRGPWIIAAAIVVAAVIVVGGFVWWQTKQEACDRWREDYRAAVDGAVAEIGAAPALPGATPGPRLTRAAEVANEQPGGCARPEVAVPLPSPSI